MKELFLILTLFLNLVQINLDFLEDSLRRLRDPKGDFEQLKLYLGEDITKEVIKDLARIGFSKDEMDKAISEVVKFVPLEKVPMGWWPNVSNVGMTLAFIVLSYDKELDTKYHLLHEADLMKKVGIYKGKSLDGLRYYFRETPPEKLMARFPHLKEEYFADPDIKRFYILIKALRVAPQGPKQWSECIASYRRFPWKWLKYEPIGIQKSIIERAFREELFPRLSKIDPSLNYYNLDYYFPGEFINASMLTNSIKGVDLRVSFLGNKDLEGFYELHGSNIDQFRKDFGWEPSLQEKYRWINLIRSRHPLWGGFTPLWESGRVPDEILGHLCLRIAQEIGKDPRELVFEEDFLNLDFLGRKDLGWPTKGLTEMVLAKRFGGIEKFREEIIFPMVKKIEQEVENIKREISDIGIVQDWNKYSLWAKKTYLEQEILKGSAWQKIKESDLPEGFIKAYPFTEYLDMMKAILWVDLDLYERILIHPITTEDYVTRLLFDFPILEWEKTSKGMRKDWVRMLAHQLKMEPLEFLENLKINPKLAEIVIDFKSDPLGIFSETFRKLLPLLPEAKPTEDWSLSSLLNEAYKGDIDKLRDLFRED